MAIGRLLGVFGFGKGNRSDNVLINKNVISLDGNLIGWVKNVYKHEGQDVMDIEVPKDVLARFPVEVKEKISIKKRLWKKYGILTLSLDAIFSNNGAIILKTDKNLEEVYSIKKIDKVAQKETEVEDDVKKPGLKR